MRPADIQQIIHCIDLTRLNEHDTEADIRALCRQSLTPAGNVAAICVYPRFVGFAWQQLIHSPIKIATVVNFPTGKSNLKETTEEIKKAILDGAHEIDLVIPYFLYETQEREKVRYFIEACKTLCGKKLSLKVILETGMLSSKDIRHASEDAIAAGADFLKTSTGKTSVGATPEAAQIMLEAIKASQKPVGFKVSGGIRTLEQVYFYTQLTQDILGEKTLIPNRFRIGTSQILTHLLEKWHEFHS